jgi:hypothetical protein
MGDGLHASRTYCNSASTKKKKARAVVDEIKAAGGDGIAVGGDVLQMTFLSEFLTLP